MGSVAEGLFSGVSSAKTRRGSNYIKPGHYLARIDRMKADRNRKGDGFLAIEMTCVVDLSADDGKQHHRTGEQFSHLLMKRHDSFLGNVRAFVVNVCGVAEDEVEDKHAIQLCDESNPMRWTVVELVAKAVPTNSGGVFTEVTYRRAADPSEVLGLFDSERGYFGGRGAQWKERLFPDGILEKMAEFFARSEG